LNIAFRRYDESTDQGLVMACWARQIRKLAPFKHMTPVEFNDHVKRVIVPMVESFPPLIACEGDHPEQIFGYACGHVNNGVPFLHFAYVRSTWRRQGIGGELLKTLFPNFRNIRIQCSHFGRSSRYLADRWKLVLNPYIVADLWEN